MGIIESQIESRPKQKGVRSQLKWPIIALLIVIMASLPLWTNEYIVYMFLLIFLYLALAEMWNLLAGYAGLVSLGQQMFIGIGGYCLAVFTEYYGAPIPVAILIGAVFAVVFGFVASQPLFRMRGMYFAIATWIVAEALVVFFSNWEYVRLGMGFFIRAGYGLTTNDMYYPALVLGIGSVFLVYFILRSKLGLGLMAMRDEEGAAETMGVQIFRSKLYCFLIGAFVTGLAGGIFYLTQGFVQPYAAFAIDWTIAIVFAVIIGGMATVEGPVIGAIIYVLLKQSLSAYPGFSLLILGVIAIAVIVFAPQGIMGLLKKRITISILDPRREAD